MNEAAATGPVDVKPGVKTTEFWVFRVIEVLQIIAGAIGIIPWDLVAGLVTGSGVTYGALRTMAKR